MPSITSLGNADTPVLVAGTDVLAPTAEQWLILKATVNNQNAATQTITVYRVPAGGTAGVANIIVDAQSVLAGETLALPISGQPILENQTLRAIASVTNDMIINVGYAVLA